MNSPFAGRYPLLSLFIAGLCLWSPAPGIAQPQPRTDYLGDPLPEGALFRLGTARLRHPETIECLRFLDDQKLMAVGYTQPSVWDVETGKRIQTEASEFELVDKSTGKSILARTNPALWTLVAFGREGDILLAVDYFDVVTAWDLSSGKEAKREQLGLIESLSADRKSPQSALVQFSDPLTGQQKQTQVRYLGRSRNWSLAKSGKHVSLYYWSSGESRESEPGTPGKEPEPRWAQAAGGVYDLRAILNIPEKKLAVISDWEPIGVKNLADGEFIWRKEITPPNESGWGSKTNRINCLALSPDGKVVAAGTDSGYIELLDVATGERTRGSRSHPGFISGPVQFVSGGKYVVVTVSGEAVLWDLAAGKKVRGFGGGSGDFDHIPAPDGNSILVEHWDDDVRRLSLEETLSGKKRWTLQEPYDALIRVRFSTDGRIIAIDPREKDTTYVSASTGKPLASSEIQESLFPLSASSVKRRAGIRNLHLEAFSPDGRFILNYVRASKEVPDDYFEVRDLDSGERALKLDPGPPGRNRNMFRRPPVGRFSADSKIFAYRRGDSIEFYDLETKQQVGPARPHPAPIWNMTFAPTGSILAASCNDSTVILWDARASTK